VKKVNTNELEELVWKSPRGKYQGAGKQVSEALGRVPASMDLNERPPGATPYVYHSHSAQWEFYHIIAGSGVVRDESGRTPVVAGDAFVFKPGEAHQLTNTGTVDMIVYVIADNPVGESAHYPDSEKWVVRSPERRLIRSEPLDYFDGEE
jgi:uncharacterized cupin superfamily protein